LYGGGPLKSLAILSVLAYLGVVAVNALAEAVPLNGVGTGRLSDDLPNLFVPAGLTFSVWGLIYLLLAGYVIAVVGEAFRHPAAQRAWTATDALLFIANAIANMGWIVAWHWRMVRLSLLIMLVVLGTLIALGRRILWRLAPGAPLASASKTRRFFLSVPIRVYLGWICVATLANVTALFVALGGKASGIDERLWAVVAIALGLCAALDFAWRRREVAAPFVVVWAYAGIVLKRLTVDADYSRPVWIAAALSILLILAAVGVQRIRSRTATSS
jgi:hypothetical protein